MEQGLSHMQALDQSVLEAQVNSCHSCVFRYLTPFGISSSSKLLVPELVQIGLSLTITSPNNAKKNQVAKTISKNSFCMKNPTDSNF